MPESFVQSSLSRFPAKGTLVVLLVVLCLEDSQVSVQSANTHESTCSSSEHCLSSSDSEDTEDDTTSLLQARVKADLLSDAEFEKQGGQSQAEAEAATPSGKRAKPKNVVALLEGTGKKLGDHCTWPSDEQCTTNLQKMYEELQKVDKKTQIVHYEQGVGTSDGESPITGTGTRQHAYNVYDWLSQNYADDDLIYLFGFSRGTLSARIVQGMLKCVGLAKPMYISEAKAFFEAAEGDCGNSTKSFKYSDKSRSVKVKFMGFYDAVLRTMFLKSTHYIKSLMMTMTDVVEEFRHAMALDDAREQYVSHELRVSSSTNAKQVWFQGMHGDVGGGLRDHRLSDIALGWMAEEAMSSGLVLPDTFLPSLKPNALVDAQKKGWDVSNFMLGALAIRNPVKCRKELFDNTPILVHQSVKDHMNNVEGWVPLQHCCPQMATGMGNYSITWVEDAQYKSKKKSASSEQPPAWIKLTFGTIKDAACHEGLWSVSEYYVTAQSWLSKVELPGSSGDTGCCQKVSLHANDKKAGSTSHGGSWYSRSYLCHSDFEERFIMLPYESSVADGVFIQVWEDDVLRDDFVGGIWIYYNETNKGLQTYDIKMDNGESVQGKLEVKMEPYYDDLSVQQLLGGENASTPAQCQWLLTHSGKSHEWLCGKDQPWKVIDSVLTNLGLFTPDTCPLFLEDITSAI